MVGGEERGGEEGGERRWAEKRPIRSFLSDFFLCTIWGCGDIEEVGLVWLLMFIFWFSGGWKRAGEEGGRRVSSDCFVQLSPTSTLLLFSLCVHLISFVEALGAI